MRHFRARNIVLDHQNLTGSYAELRYHLFNAGRTQELRDVALRLCDHFTSTWNAASPVPQDRAELDERIGVLSALLQDGGPKSLEYYLARCLKTRGSARDLEDAVVHVSRATEGKAPAAAWLLRAQLHSDLGDSERSIQACIDAVRVVDPGDAIGTLYGFGARVLFQQGKVDEAVAFLRAGILIVPPSKNLFTLYQSAAELLGQAGKTDEAVELLKEGIKVIPADKSLSSLYQSAAELLGRAGKTDAAVELLKEGIKVIPADKSLFSLYQSAAELLGQAGKTDAAVELLKEGIKVIPADKNLFALYQSAAELLGQAGKTDAAVELLREGIKVIPADKNLFALYQSAAELLGQAGKTDAAVELLREGIKVIPADKNLFALYQSAAELLGQAGKTDAAVELLKEGIKVIPADKSLYSLYQSAAELLGRAGKTDAAVELLKEGIKVIPADKSLFSLYQSAAELLAKGGMFEEAIVQLRAGIRSATRSGGLVFHLYQSAAELLQRFDRRPEAIELLRECIRDVPGTRSSLSVFKLAALLLSKQGMHDEAFEVLEQGNAGTASSLHQRDIYYHTKAVLLAKAGRPAEAQACLEEGLAALKPDENRFALFQLSAALLRQVGDLDGALHRLKEGIDSTPHEVGGAKLIEALCQLAYIAERRDVLAAIAAGSVPSIQCWMATVLLAQLDFDWPKAAGHAKAARAAFPSHAWFATAEAFALLAQGEALAANAALNSFRNLELPVGSAVTWLCCLAATLAGDIGRARFSLVRYLRFGKGAETNPSSGALLTLWNTEIGLTEPHPAYIFPVLPPAITGLPAPVRRGPQGEVSELISSATVGGTGSPNSPLEREDLNAGITTPALKSILLMATEWRSVHGGLSTFNRQLCRTLASQGHTVVCAVPSATPEEVSEAQQDGVWLVVASALAGSEQLSGLYRPLPLSTGFVPDVVIGHGRITGAAAKAQSTDHFRDARRIHFVHMAPGEIEWFKEGENPAALGEARERIEGDLAADADLVAAVGPRLRREFADLLRGIGAQKDIFEFLPGPELTGPNVPPHLSHCLVLGRVDDYELKGLDIAARALGLVVASRRFAGEPPELVVRGAKPGTATELRNRLKMECPGIDLAVRVREYDSSEETIESDLRRATLVLMPSRREGFGLVSLEALSKGVPILVSDTSGFGEVLQRTAPGVLARNAVVTTPQEVDAAARYWADAIAMQLLDPAASFSRASELGRLLAQTHSWDGAVRSLMDRLRIN